MLCTRTLYVKGLFIYVCIWPESGSEHSGYVHIKHMYKNTYTKRNRNSLQTEPIESIEETHLVINAQLQVESTLQSRANQNKVFPFKTSKHKLKAE